MIIIELTTEAEVHMHSVCTKLYEILKLMPCGCCSEWNAGHKQANIDGRRQTSLCPKHRGMALYEKEIGLGRITTSIIPVK